MASKKEQEKEIMVDMSDLIALLIRETIDADQAVTKDYLKEIQDYAFETKDKKSPTLKTISFEMTDDEGQRQRVTVPLLSLLPLPVLHISEATFDLETQMSIVEEKATTQEDKNEGKDELPTIPNRSPGIEKPELTPQDPTTQVVTYMEDPLFDLKKRKTTLQRRLKMTIPTAKGIENVKRNTENPTQQEEADETPQYFNAKIHVKLEQTPLPSGMMGMLQETDRSITTTLIE